MRRLARRDRPFDGMRRGAPVRRPACRPCPLVALGRRASAPPRTTGGVGRGGVEPDVPAGGIDRPGIEGGPDGRRLARRDRVLRVAVVLRSRRRLLRLVSLPVSGTACHDAVRRRDRIRSDPKDDACADQSRTSGTIYVSFYEARNRREKKKNAPISRRAIETRVARIHQILSFRDLAT